MKLGNEGRERGRGKVGKGEKNEDEGRRGWLVVLKYREKRIIMRIIRKRQSVRQIKCVNFL